MSINLKFLGVARYLYFIEYLSKMKINIYVNIDPEATLKFMNNLLRIQRIIYTLSMLCSKLS